jgi:hypothetical protein
MATRRWDDLRQAIESYSRQVDCDASLLFHSAIVLKVLNHALTLTDAGPFWECLNAVCVEIDHMASGRTLDEAIAGYRRALERRDALIAFEQLGTPEGSVN